MNSLHSEDRSLAAALLAGAASAVPAQELKIGYVNSDRVLRDAVPAKAAQAKLEAEFSQAREGPHRAGEPAEGAPATSSTRTRRRSPRPSAARRQRELVDQDRELQRKRREFQEDLSQRKNEELAAVVERTNRVIKQIFETEKYDLILQEAVFCESQGRHHRQGDQGAQRPGRQVTGCRRVPRSARSPNGSAAN